MVTVGDYVVLTKPVTEYGWFRSRELLPAGARGVVVRTPLFAGSYEVVFAIGVGQMLRADVGEDYFVRVRDDGRVSSW